MDVVAVVRTHIMGIGPGRLVKTCGPPYGQGGAADIKSASHESRPGPAHQFF